MNPLYDFNQEVLIMHTNRGSEALHSKMLLLTTFAWIRNIENNKVDAYLNLGQVSLSKGRLCPAELGKGLG